MTVYVPPTPNFNFALDLAAAGINLAGLFTRQKPKKSKVRLCTQSETVEVDRYLRMLHKYELSNAPSDYGSIVAWERNHKELLEDIRSGACTTFISNWKPPKLAAGLEKLSTPIAGMLRKVPTGTLRVMASSAIGAVRSSLPFLGIREGDPTEFFRRKFGISSRKPLTRAQLEKLQPVKVTARKIPVPKASSPGPARGGMTATITGAPAATTGMLGRIAPYLAALLPLVQPSAAAPRARVNFNPSFAPTPLLPPAVSPVPVPSLTPLQSPGVGSCQCPPKKPRGPRKPRSVCYTGRFIERLDGTRKYSKRKVPCRPSSAKLRS